MVRSHQLPLILLRKFLSTPGEFSIGKSRFEYSTIDPGYNFTFSIPAISDNANQFVAAQCPVLQNETISCLSSIPNVDFRLATSIAEEIAATPESKKEA